MSRIYKRGKNWYIDFEYKDKRYRKSLATASKQIAELALKDTDVKIARERSDFAQSKEISFRDFSKKFLEWYEVQNAEKSFQDYRNLFFSTIVPFFDQINLTDITVEMIEKYKSVRIKRIAPSTLNKELIALRHVFNKAKLWGYMNQNPAMEVKKLRVKQKSFRFLTLEEIDVLMEICCSRSDYFPTDLPDYLRFFSRIF